MISGVLNRKLNEMVNFLSYKTISNSFKIAYTLKTTSKEIKKIHIGMHHPNKISLTFFSKKIK